MTSSLPQPSDVRVRRAYVRDEDFAAPARDQGLVPGLNREVDGYPAPLLGGLSLNYAPNRELPTVNIRHLQWLAANRTGFRIHMSVRGLRQCSVQLCVLGVLGGILLSGFAERASGQAPDARLRLLKQFDRDGDGKLSVEERRLAQQQRGRLTGTPQAQRLLERFDANKNGRLEPAERESMQAALRSGGPKQAPAAKPAAPSETETPAMARLLRQFDKNGNGKLDPAERRSAFQSMRNAHPAAIAPSTRVSKQAALDRFDANGDGTLDSQERANAFQALGG